MAVNTRKRVAVSATKWAEGVVLYDLNGVALLTGRQLADSMSLPVAPDVIAHLMGLDSVTGTDMDIVRVTGGRVQVTGIVSSSLHSDNGSAAGYVNILSNSSASSGVPASAPLLKANTGGFYYERGNEVVTVLTSAARTSSTNSADQTNPSCRGVLLALDVTATPNNAETLTLAVQVKDAVSSKYVTITAFTALTASVLGATPTTETYLFTVYPGAAETAAVSKHEVQALSLPFNWRVAMTHSSTGSWTYTVGAQLLK